MTDIEKRAHDFALAVMTAKSQILAADSRVKGIDIKMDFMSLYLAAYREALDKFQILS